MLGALWAKLQAQVTGGVDSGVCSSRAQYNDDKAGSIPPKAVALTAQFKV